MSRNNSFGINESIVHGKDGDYSYRRGMGMFNSFEWVAFYDEFDGSPASNAYPGWTAIIDTGGTATSAAIAGGGAAITSDGTTEGVSLYRGKSVQLSGRKFFMEVRVKTLDADDTDVKFGLTDLIATTNPEDLWATATADGIAAGVTDGSAALTLVYDKNNGGPVTETSSAVLEDDTWAVLAITYNGAETPGEGSLRLWKDGEVIATAATVAQIPEDLALAPFIGARTGGDAAHIVTFDYARYAVQTGR